jgi:hypothetical protein
MKVIVTVEIDTEGRTPIFPGYILRTVTRKGTTFNQWYMTGPRHISLETKRKEGR